MLPVTIIRLELEWAHFTSHNSVCLATQHR